MKKTLLETEVRTRSKQQPRAEEPQNFITVPLHRTQKIERLKQVNPGWSGSRQWKSDDQPSIQNASQF